ncbi:MAG: hypothetical protein R3Y59_10745 [bacterium]
MKRILLFFAIILTTTTIASAQQYRDVIYLNNGSVIKGVIIEQVLNQTYTIETSDGSKFVCKWDDVIKITKEEVVVNASNRDNEIIPIKYLGEAFTGFGFGVGSYSLDRFYLHTVQGVKIGDYFSTGLGVGLNMIMPYEFWYNLPELFMPIYVNFKGYLPLGTTSLFASFDIGGAFGLTEGVTGLRGLLVAPAIGVSIKNKVNVSLTYEVQTISDVIVNMNIDALTIKAGYVF